ncbi:hypothetical protein Rhopal_001617-T1 [Rhodotorula paludigena]|uniref:Mitochondrial carrier protein n=1 Tax=Rhodotorula paludigena TaxID=86838 RepID=A0AAV5G7W8_9BASI|nr:hypothetical protein Rhopal_001617-T1 [Rhodotorula paludigena]
MATTPGSADERRPLLSGPSSAPTSSSAYASVDPASRPAEAPQGTSTSRSRVQKPVQDSPARAESEDDEDDDDEEAPEPEADPSQRRRSLLRWTLFWALVVGVTVFLIVQAFRQGGGEFDWKGALKKAGGGGLAGAMAMIVQVLTLMPLRTVMNYQYRYGTTTTEASKKLYAEGGYGRYWAGLGPALVQGPVARFGDTAANAGILALLASNPFLSKLPSPLKTAFASLAGALFRMVLMPVDCLKTTMQTEGSSRALSSLRARIRAYGPGTLWAGAWATAAANWVGSFPWFSTYNALQAYLPPAPDDGVWLKLGRQALIGFVASVVSDTCSNSLRVVKTYRQVSRKKVGYRQAASDILRTEGARGLFGRGLKTRYLANGLQGLLFSVLWKAFAELIEGGGKKG